MASNLLVTGKWGEVHVTSAQQRNFNSGIVGDGQYVMNGLTATMSDSNTLHVNPGVACMNGADVEVPAGGVDVTVTNGTQGMLRNDLICVRYTMEGSTQKESVELVCVRGTPAASDPQDPEYNDGSILDGSLVVDMPLYRVPLDGISVGDPEPLFDVLMPMAEMWDSVSPTDLGGHWHRIDLPGGYAALTFYDSFTLWDGETHKTVSLPLTAESCLFVDVSKGNGGWVARDFYVHETRASEVELVAFLGGGGAEAGSYFNYRLVWIGKVA